MAPAAAALAVLAVALFVWLARGRAAARAKRLVFRLTLVAALAGIVATGSRYGVFARSTVGFRVALLLVVVSVLLGYLYAVRFCPSCGRMERNLRRKTCARCGAQLPRDGFR